MVVGGGGGCLSSCFICVVYVNIIISEIYIKKQKKRTYLAPVHHLSSVIPVHPDVVAAVWSVKELPLPCLCKKGMVVCHS